MNLTLSVMEMLTKHGHQHESMRVIDRQRLVFQSQKPNTKNMGMGWKVATPKKQKQVMIKL